MVVGPGPASSAPDRAADRPPAGVGEAARPRGRAPHVGGAGGYRFFWTQSNSRSPVAWDPCREVHYVVHGSPPPGAGGLLADALARVGRATGLVLVSDGVSDERPGDGRAAYQPQRYGRRWAPLLIAWSDSGETPGFAGDWVGLTSPLVVSDARGRAIIVSGTVLLDRDKFASELGRSEASQVLAMRAVVLHELGHAVGLAHVQDPHQVMYGRTVAGVGSFAAGDLRGLAALGRGTCAPDL